MSRFHPRLGHTGQMEPVDSFSQHRGYLFGLAYRMTGSAADADDLVQETWLRWQRAETDEIRTPRAFLTTVLTRLAISHMQSAQVRREEYVGPWIPEPVVTAAPPDPVELAESLQMAFLVLLESLSPQERAVFLLAEVFEYPHAEIAAILGKNEEACRQLLHRAKKAVARRSPRFAPAPEVVQNLSSRFFQAVQAGRVDEVMSLLDDRAVVWSDGGGRTRAALNPIYGSDRVARFLIGIARKTGHDLVARATLINGQPGILGFHNGTAQTAIVLDFDRDRICAIYIVVNPDKLQRLPKEESIDDHCNLRTPPQLPAGLS